MCGRYMITSPFAAMATLFDARPALGPDAPRRNVSPTEAVPVALSGGGTRASSPCGGACCRRWTRPRRRAAADQRPVRVDPREPAFRAAARERRCLLPADGFYEWQGEKGAKTPYLIRPAGGGPFAFAGVWQDWRRPVARIPTCAIVTCAANARLAPIHDRMPVMIAPADFALWLGEAGPGAARLMIPAHEDFFVAAPADAATRAILARRGG